MKKLLTTAGGLLALSLAASASQISVTCSEIGPSLTEISGNISCAQFNLVGQTLTGVDVTISGGISGTISLTNGSSTSSSMRGTTTSDLFVNTVLAGYSYSTPLDAVTMSYNTGFQTVGANSTYNSGTLNQTGNDDLGHITSGIGSYTGGGNFQININTLSGFTVTGGNGQGSGSQVTDAFATATVVYDYQQTTGTPEPTTLALVGSALLGLGLISRKRISR